jgi:hypothetical protein
MRKGSRPVLALVMVGLAALAGVSAPAAAQTEQRPFMTVQGPMLVSPPLPPATLMEGFRAPVGALVTVGHEVIGEVAEISVDARELRDSTGGLVRGVVVEVTAEEKAPQQSAARQSASQQSYIDVDELPDLLRGIDQLLSVTWNPTQFRNFEMYYATKGDLELTASSSRNRGVVYSVQVGRLSKARREGLTAGELKEIRTLIEAASQRLATLRSDRE